MNARLILLTLLLSFAFNPLADAGARLDVRINYGSAYRDGSWVPVDVTVTNDAQDVAGWVEVRTIALTGDVQSPYYRIPAVCPRNSRKRFRLQCRLLNTSRVEVRLYDGQRLVNRAPTVRDVDPIAPDDRLALILDEQVTDYGFLSSVMLKENTRLRLHRENLTDATIALLADYPQCYHQFDVIALGDIDPAHIRERHRLLLHNYVIFGGTLVIFTGAHATRYHDSWVEELAGVSIGRVSLQTGKALAHKVFTESDETGATTARQGMVAKLDPQSQDVKRIGTDIILATRRSLGRGHVVTLAIDASSHLLQDCEGYHKVWRTLLRFPGSSKSLAYERAAGVCAQYLPQELGIAIPPRTSVLTYLGLYFLVGIVINWVVCTRYGRKELAWLVLIVISAGFTAFAIFFGPGGAAAKRETVQVDVMRVPCEGNWAEVHSYVGMMSSRTSTVAAHVNGAFSLVSDTSSAALPGPYARRPRRPGFHRAAHTSGEPFYFLLGKEPKILAVEIPARGLRVVEVLGLREETGRLSGNVFVNDEELRCVVKNPTALKPESLFLVHRGSIYTLPKVKGGFRSLRIANAARAESDKGHGLKAFPPSRPFLHISRRLLSSLLTDPEADTAKRPRSSSHPTQGIGKNLGPLVVGWLPRPIAEPLRWDTESEAGKGLTLIIWDIPEEDRRSDTGTNGYKSNAGEQGAGESLWQ